MGNFHSCSLLTLTTLAFGNDHGNAMWVLSWDDRSIWLRPGSKHLFGRLTAKPQGVQRHHHIAHKSVSRKHLWLEIGNVDNANDLHDSDVDSYLSGRSSVTVTGEGKTGTYVDEERLPADDQTRTLSGTKHTFKLGSAESVLVLEWRPVVIGFSAGVSKAQRANGTALAKERSTFAGCDLKLVPEYVPGKTTHTIAKKRNTGAALHALIQGSWLVTASFVDALAAACKQDGQEEDGSPRPSLLEEDFDKHWPREDAHIVPASTEPKPRENSWLKPDPARAELFQHYTFVFMDPSQHETLAPVIGAAGGKTLCFEFTLGETSIKSVTDYVKGLVGKKESLGFSLGDEPGPGGIVIVQMKDTEKFRDVHAELDDALNQRSIEQGELLDVVLSVDTSSLRQTPPLQQRRATNAITGSASERPSISSVPPPSGSLATSRIPASSEIVAPPRSTDAVNMQQAENSQAPPPTRKRRRFETKKFELDELEPSSILRAPSRSPEASYQQANNHRETTPAKSMDVDMASQVPNTSQRGPQKRPAPVEEEEPNKETAEQRQERMFPGQAMYKRRKIEEAKQAAAAPPRPTPAPEAVKEKEEPKSGKAEAKPKKGKKAVDETRAKMIAKREAQEEEHRRDEEALQQGYQGEELPFLGDKDQNPEMFAQMELPVRVIQPSFTVSDNPAWAGRPNFKKFRKRQPNAVQEKVRAAAEDDSQSRSHIIVLEDRSSRTNGLGEEHWLENGDANPRKKGQSRSQTASQGRVSQGREGAAVAGSSVNNGENNTREVVDEEERAVFRRRLHSSRQMDEDEAEANAMFDAPRGSKSTSKSTSQSTLGTDTQKRAAGKRPATTQLSAPVAKQARTVATSVNSRTVTPATAEVSDDDDPRAFRRRRR